MSILFHIEKQPTEFFDSIIEIVCQYYDMPVEELSKKTRKSALVKVRQVCWYFGKKYTQASYAYIAKQFEKDHATACSSCKTVDNLIFSDPKFRGEMYSIRQQIEDRLIGEQQPNGLF